MADLGLDRLGAGRTSAAGMGDAASQGTTFMAQLATAQADAPVQVPGPGASWFGLGSPPSSVQGALHGGSGMTCQVDRDNGVLNLFGPDGDMAASLSPRGNSVMTPDGHQVGTLRPDGGFDLERGFAADLERCHGAPQAGSVSV